MLKIKLGVNLEVKLGVGSKTGSKKSVFAFLKCTDGFVLAHLRFPMPSAPTRFPQSGNSEVP